MDIQRLLGIAISCGLSLLWAAVVIRAQLHPVVAFFVLSTGAVGIGWTTGTVVHYIRRL